MPKLDLVAISRDLGAAVDRLSFGPPVTHVYNPLRYAAPLHEAYLERHGRGRKEVLLLGMNPGPFGMVQTGVPFGDVSMVRDWMDFDVPVSKPAHEHPKRPVLGLACSRGEVSGTRLWGWARDRFGTPGKFFARFFVLNYCPLAFVEESGRNRTPDKLPASEQAALFAVCDRALARAVEALKPQHVIGVGAFAAKRAEQVLSATGVAVSTILHPSPASPAANRDWAGQIERQLRLAGIAVP